MRFTSGRRRQLVYTWNHGHPNRTSIVRQTCLFLRDKNRFIYFKIIIYHISTRKYPPHLFKRDQRRNVTCDIITFIDGGNVFCASDTLLVLHFSYILETFLLKNSIKCTHFVLTLCLLSLLLIILLEMYGWMVSIRENYCYKPWLLDFTLDALAEMDPNTRRNP